MKAVQRCLSKSREQEAGCLSLQSPLCTRIPHGKLGSIPLGTNYRFRVTGKLLKILPRRQSQEKQVKHTPQEMGLSAALVLCKRNYKCCFLSTA